MPCGILQSRRLQYQVKGTRGGQAGLEALPQARCQRCSIYKWKAKFGGMDVSEAKRLKTLEDENTKLKRLLADAMLDNFTLETC